MLEDPARQREALPVLAAALPWPHIYDEEPSDGSLAYKITWISLVPLQGEVVPSDLLGLAMAGDEGPLERAEEIGFGPLTRDAGRKVLARAGASEAD